MSDETPFLRPIEYVKINSNYANRKLICDIIFAAIVLFVLRNSLIYADGLKSNL